MPPATQKSENPEANSPPGDFYVQVTCCLSCGVPQVVAPDLVGWRNDDPSQCRWLKQPQTAEELDRAINVLQTQELGCHRYSGKDPAILKRLPAEECDHLRPDLKLHAIRNFASSGPAPKFTLSVSAKQGVFSKLWRLFLQK